MHSFLLFGPDNNKQLEYIHTLCEKMDIGKFDQTMFTTDQPSFGIQDVRDMQKAAMRKPVTGNRKALIIASAQLLTVDAQNALLKLLEEPPHGTYIFLQTPTLTPFLPTILSRCKTVSLGTKEQLTSEQKAKLLIVFQQIAEGTLADKLSLAEALSSKKEELSSALVGLLEVGREKLLENPNDQNLLNTLGTIQHAYQTLQSTNVAPRMILEHALLTL